MLSRSLQGFAAGALLLMAAAACNDSDPASPGRAPVASVRVSPAQHSLVVGQTVQLDAVPLASDGDALDDRSVTWSSSDDAVATVSANGLVEAKAAGPVTITATSETIQGRAVIDVSRVPVATVSTNVIEIALELGETHSLSAFPKDAAGNVLGDRVCIWLSSDPMAAAVTPTGLTTATVTTHRTATVTLTARCETKTADVALSITPVRVARVVPSVTSIVLDEAGVRQLTAVAYDKNGNELVGRGITWTSSNAGVARITAQGQLTALVAGEAGLTVTVGEASAAVSVRVTAAPLFDLVYSRSFAGATEIFVLPLRGDGSPQRLNAGTVSGNPTARPDGERIAFEVSMWDQGTQQAVYDIFAVNRDGTQMKRLITSGLGQGTDEPAWSPDGTRIAFRRARLATADTDLFWGAGTDVWVMNADGTNQVNLTGHFPVGTYSESPTWSPDSRQIAFVRGDANSNSGIWVMNAQDGTGKRAVVAAAGQVYMPTWSPDGTRLAFVRDGGPALGVDLVVVNLDGTGLRPIAIPDFQSQPAWSPDGEYIAFSARGASGRTEIFTVRPDGTDIRLRTTNAEWNGGENPAWIRRR